MNVEDAFTKVVGRQASAEERERLHRLRDALGLRDNDAFWCIVMALEHYDSWFRQYPARLGEETRQAIEQARTAFAAAADKESAQLRNRLAGHVVQMSEAIARKRSERPLAVHEFTQALAACVVFGTLCLHAGYELGLSESHAGTSTFRAQGLLARVLGLPAGWMIFALLLPTAAWGARWGWAMAADALGTSRDKMAGGFIVAACVVGAIACAVALVRMIGPWP